MMMTGGMRMMWLSTITVIDTLGNAERCEKHIWFPIKLSNIRVKCVFYMYTWVKTTCATRKRLFSMRKHGGSETSNGSRVGLPGHNGFGWDDLPL